MNEVPLCSTDIKSICQGQGEVTPKAASPEVDVQGAQKGKKTRQPGIPRWAEPATEPDGAKNMHGIWIRGDGV